MAAISSPNPGTVMSSSRIDISAQNHKTLNRRIASILTISASNPWTMIWPTWSQMRIANCDDLNLWQTVVLGVSTANAWAVLWGIRVDNSIQNRENPNRRCSWNPFPHPVLIPDLMPERPLAAVLDRSGCCQLSIHHNHQAWNQY
jgi:hypothetical protein